MKTKRLFYLIPFLKYDNGRKDEFDYLTLKAFSKHQRLVKYENIVKTQQLSKVYKFQTINCDNLSLCPTISVHH